MASISKLVSKYGPEPLNYFGSSFLNRVSFLRDDYAFLNAAFTHPASKFLILKNLSPPVVELEKTDDVNSEYEKGLPRAALHALKYLSRDSKPLVEFLGDPFAVDEEEQISNWDSTKDAIGYKPLVVFLGIDESAPDSDSVEYKRKHKQPGSEIAEGETYKGQAYFAVDVSDEYLKTDALKEKVSEILALEKLKEASFLTAPFSMRLAPKHSGVFAQARMYIDWNSRNRFCGGCGVPNMSVNGGCKLTCPSHDAGKELPYCPTRGRISNLSFPRTDSSIIAAVVNYDGDKILLGRSKRWPKGFYSCLAGFLEPAETIEECVRREIWEEAGVHVGRVIVHSTQPWPYPANIMVGCIAQVTENTEQAHKIHLGHDPELEDAQWFSIKELKESGALKYAFEGFLGSRPKELAEGAPQLPQPEAIAYTLIDAVVEGKY